MAETNRRRTLILDFLRVLDGSFIVLAAVLAAQIRFGEWLPPSEFSIMIVFAPLIFLTYMQLADGYRYFLPDQAKIGVTKLFLGLGLVYTLLLITAFFTKSSAEFSRLWVGYWGLLAPSLMVGGRLLLAAWLRDTKQAALMVPQAVILAGEGVDVTAFLHHLSTRCEDGELNVCRIFQAQPPQAGSVQGGPHEEAGPEALIDYVRRNSVDYLLLALREADRPRLTNVLEKLRELSITVLEAPIDGQLKLIRLEQNCDWVILAGLPFRRLSIQPYGNRGWLLKAAEDYILGSICLLLSAPLMALIALTIKLTSPGPVFFKQKRHGFNGEEIWVYKFRSMIDGRKEEPDVPQATKDDPRVTKVGKILRKTSLDELPQLINVLKGEMSLVGPRPHAVEHNKSYAGRIDEYLARHRVKPGITGWAQVNGWRGETETDEKMMKRVMHDLYYINNWSLIFDIRILVMTVFVIMVNKNAY